MYCTCMSACWAVGGAGGAGVCCEATPVREGCACGAVQRGLVHCCACTRLQAQKESLVKAIDALKEDIQKRQEKLESLQPSLSSLLKVALMQLAHHHAC